ncbi:hypothetical protein [Bradyrhizobium sp. CCGB20]|uniref:hypothetical protein n=1 Tax=Bradyrhizobium sp. CCGB20 TaxID=2949633 RepID=UPI0020B434FA|nr:hypothetical protein [Bradyrhizobium sp. CCGB20]MCP3400493.1 hypothetical protein [Bradyrhizobium sp. CCGB20]
MIDLDNARYERTRTIGVVLPVSIADAIEEQAKSELIAKSSWMRRALGRASPERGVMTDLFEELIASEAVRQGFTMNSEAMRTAVVDLCGSSLTEDRMFHMPGRGSISMADFVLDLRGRMPNAFVSLVDERQTEATTGNLTEQMRQEVAANRRQRALPSDWLALRSKATGTTAAHMAERERNWK